MSVQTQRNEFQEAVYRFYRQAAKLNLYVLNQKKSKRLKLESGFDFKNIYAIMLISKRLIRRIPIQNKI